MIRPISVERLRALGGGVVAEAALELPQDGVAGVAAHADDEGEAEFLAISLIEARERRELGGAEAVEAEASLLRLGRIGEAGGLADPAAQFRVSSDEGQLPLRGLPPHRADHGVMQRCDREVGPSGHRGLRHPGRMFEHFAECRDKGLRGHRIEAGQGQGRSGHRTIGGVSPKGRWSPLTVADRAWCCDYFRLQIKGFR